MTLTFRYNSALMNLDTVTVLGKAHSDVILFQCVGPKIRRLSLMLNSPKSMREDDISSMDYVNTVPFLCPNLEEVYLGYKQVRTVLCHV